MTTLDRIHALANERQSMYRQAGSSGNRRYMTGKDVARIRVIDSELANLWDSHRRELAEDPVPRPKAVLEKASA